MTRRRVADASQTALAFDVVDEQSDAAVFDTGAAFGADVGVVLPIQLGVDVELMRAPSRPRAPLALVTDAAVPDTPDEFSENTRIHVVRRGVAVATGTTVGVSNAKQVFIDVPARVDGGDVAKPPYRVPLMSEIAALPWNGLTIVSTFSGCGGSCLGFKMAGYRVAWANEFVPAAQETYRANHAGTILSTADIRTVTGAQIREAIGDVEIDVLEGSPPCASFSTAGKTSKGWGQVRKYSDVEQRTDDLFEQYIRLIDELRPRAFVAENVSGMVKGVSKGFFKEYLAAMKRLPYNVEARLLDAQWLGVPQARVRVIFVGVRQDVGAPTFPKKLPYRYSVRDALPWIVSSETQLVRGGAVPSGPRGDVVDVDGPAPTITGGNEGGKCTLYVETKIVGDGVRPDVERSVDEPAMTIGAHPGGRLLHIETRRLAKTGGVVVPDNVAPSLDGYAIGDEWDRLSADGTGSEKFFNLVRPALDAPCPTITQTGGNTAAASVTHPTERRKFTIAELRRICGFPDDFILTGTYTQQWERLGRSVPPPMMRAVAAALEPVLLGRDG